MMAPPEIAQRILQRLQNCLSHLGQRSQLREMLALSVRPAWAGSTEDFRWGVRGELREGLLGRAFPFHFFRAVIVSNSRAMSIRSVCASTAVFRSLLIRSLYYYFCDVFCVPTTGASGHDVSQSDSKIEIHGKDVTVSLRLNLLERPYVDVNGDGYISYDELDQSITASMQR